ncbi:salicylate hydroxylase [Paramagnetospirillum kuznetsovii]|uniref:Salicylate hydroxylase n=1 Tax=Paramagnetospirillum kuznetsovii TaxID=2053833 RepID=A0A364NWG6_9PROT|nr:3-hydroxybenzoate 6-monooxygenase [Paramagnetospirillum kuznetsovii]RAU21439.1 salicylate hydroxylase [Paramagnetospirillum kuznetsovii]
MGSKAKRKVIIAGGGIGGLSAALGLANKGCSVTVLEQSEKFGEIGAGIQIGPNAFHAMDYLGVGDAGRAKAVYIDKLVMMDGLSGDQIAQIPVDEPFRKRFGNPYAVIHRADLHGVFLDGCVKHPDITLINTERAVAYENTASGAKVITEKGSVYEGDAVIGCDGVRSKLREQLTGGDALRLSGHVAYRAVLPIDKMPEDLRWNAATLWAGPKCHMVHYPLQGWKTFNLVATFVTDIENVGTNEPGHRDEVLSRFGDIVPRARKLLEVPTEWRRWVLGDREPIENWSDGNVTLLGDAAHPTHQYFAQGACMAMEDAVCLADRVEKFDGDFKSAFIAYQDERIIRAYRVVLSSRQLGLLYHAQGVERKIRNAVLGAKSPNDFYNSLEWLYGGTGLGG